MTGLILVVLFVALLAMWFPDVMVPGLLAGIAVTLGLGLVLVMRRLRRIYRQLRALNETVKRNHKRSSVWDWRLNERLTKGGGQLVAGARQVRRHELQEGQTHRDAGARGAHLGGDGFERLGPARVACTVGEEDQAAAHR